MVYFLLAIALYHQRYSFVKPKGMLKRTVHRHKHVTVYAKLGVVYRAFRFRCPFFIFQNAGDGRTRKHRGIEPNRRLGFSMLTTTEQKRGRNLLPYVFYVSL